MLRSASARALLRTNCSSFVQTSRHLPRSSLLKTQITTFSTASSPRSLALVPAWRKHQSATYATKIQTADGKIVKDPGQPLAGERTTRGDSSVRHVFEEVGKEGQIHDKEPPVQNALLGDLKTIQDTFALREVPRDALYLGLAGTLPYLGTSAATVACAYDINYAESHGNGIIISQESAEFLLAYLEPIQVGYGAVILSFMGAIHWGMEWAKYGGAQGARRYAIGIVAPAIAWPTLLLPYEYALISQFLGFTWLFYADSRATQRGWVPPWYSTYRFVLTFIVGASMIISLIGSGAVNDQLERRKAGLKAPGGTLKDREEQGDKERDKLLAKEAELAATRSDAKK